jgi:hypothetical protein
MQSNEYRCLQYAVTGWQIVSTAAGRNRVLNDTRGA